MGHSNQIFAVMFASALFLLTTCLCQASAQNQTDGTARSVNGSEFYVAFMQHIENTANAIQLRICISNTGQHRAEVEWHYPGTSIQQETTSIEAGKTHVHSLDSSLMLWGSGIHEKGVHIKSENNSQLIARAELEFDEKMMSMTSFPLLPAASLGTDYVAATHCTMWNCIILVMAVENATVDIDLRINNPEGSRNSVKYMGVSYNNGDTIKAIRLEEGQSVQILCELCDMTGTRVNSSGRVAVYSGGEFTKMVTDATRRDMAAAQMFPTEDMGNKYRFVSGLGQEAGPEQVVKVVPLRAGARFTYGGQCFYSFLEREVFSFEENPNLIIEILGDSQLLVAQFVAGVDDNMKQDPMMALPVPVHQWSTAYHVIIPQTLSTSSTILGFVLPIGLRVKLQGPEYNMTVGMNSTDDGYHWSNVPLPSAANTELVNVSCVSDRLCQPFSGYMMSFQNFKAFAFFFRNNLPEFAWTHQAQYEATAKLSVCTTSTSSAQEVTLPTSEQEVTLTTPEQEVTLRTFEQEVSLPTFEQEVTTSTLEQEVTTSKSEPEVTTSKLEQEVTTSKLEQEVTTSKSEQEVTTSNLEQGVTTSKSEQEVTTSKSEQEVTTSKLEQKVTTSKLEQEVTTHTFEQEVTTPKSEQEVTTSKLEQEVTTHTLEQKVTTPKFEQEVTTPKSEQDVTTPKLEQEATTPKFEQITTTSKLEQGATTYKLEQKTTTPKSEQKTTTPKIEQKDTTPKREPEKSTPKLKEEATTPSLEQGNATIAAADDDPTTVPPTQPTRATPPPKVNKPCCRCVAQTRAPKLAAEVEERDKAAAEAREAIVKELTEDKETLSKSVRAKTSAPDERPSSSTIGAAMGIFCISIVSAFIIGIDCINLCLLYEKHKAKKGQK